MVRRCVGAYDNRYANRHIFEFMWGHDALFEECEAYHFHRHGFSIWPSHNVTMRRCYANSRERHDLAGGAPSHSDEGGDEGPVFYGSSNCTAENCILDNSSEGFDVHGGTTFNGEPGGRSNRFLGCISIGGIFGGNVGSNRGARAAQDNTFRDLVVIGPTRVGLYFRWARNVLVENATLIGNGRGFGLAADQGSGGLCTDTGCSFTARNVLITNYSVGISSVEQTEFLVDHSNVFGNTTRDFAWKESIDDRDGNVKETLSVQPTKMGLGIGECVVYVPADSNMKRAGADGADIGANILYRYVDGVLTTQSLWDRRTGEFPHGALVAGLNDVAGASAFDVHRRLHVGTDGCKLPKGYGRRR